MKIIRKLTKEHILKNKRRTLVTIIAVALVSTLLFSLGLAYSTYQKKGINDALQRKNYDVSYSKIPFEKESIFKENEKIKNYSYISKIYEFDSNIQFSGEDTGISKIQIFSISENYEIEFIKGDYPKQGEIVISKFLASNLKLDVGDIYSFEIDNVKYEYKISGIFEIGDYANNNINDFTLFTKDQIFDTSETCFFVYFKNRNNAYNKIFDISEQLGLKKIYYPEDGYENVEPNYELLRLYGSYNDKTSYAMVYVSLIIILTILSIACTAIIYNSFAISLTERKKQFGILKSVGTTNAQIRKLVFNEALIVSLVGIPLGFLLSYSLVSIVISSINKLQVSINNTWEVAIYPSFMVISLVFILLTILYSALFPAIRASEITPIQAIKQTKDIKRTKYKKHHFISKLFGVTGVISYNNIKRSKKKYRISMFAITVSFLLFMTVSVFINFYQKSFLNEEIETGVYMSVGGENKDEVVKTINEITSLNEIDDYVQFETKWTMPDTKDKIYTKEYQKDYGTKQLEMSLVYKLDDRTINRLKKDYQIKNDEIIYLNYYSKEIYNDSGKYLKSVNGKIFEKDFNTKLCDFTTNYNEETKDFNTLIKDCTDTYKVRIINVPNYLKQYKIYGNYVVDKELFDTINDSHSYDFEIVLKITANDYLKLDDEISDIIKKSPLSLHWGYTNYSKDNMGQIAVLQSVKIVIYSLIALFSLIAITSIVNTIYTNMNLRKSEFAVLKSIGLDNKQFDKMLVLESLFLTIKSLIIAIPLSFAVVYAVSNLFLIDDKEYTFAYMFPTKYFIFAIIAVFIVILSSIILSTRKNKKENIIESIREENI